MTISEYRAAVTDIVTAGYGYQAIADIAGMLRNLDENKDAVIREIKAEKRAVGKILTSDSTQKEKLSAVRGLFGIKEDA